MFRYVRVVAPTGVTTGNYCGDSICNASESCQSCQADCGACPNPGGSAVVGSVVTDASGATVTFTGQATEIRFLYDGITSYQILGPVPPNTSSYRHAFAWPPNTTFACYQVRGSDGVWTEQGCNSVSPQIPTSCSDADGDGESASGCGGTDCNDNNAGIYRGATEICGDGVDQDCLNGDLSCLPNGEELNGSGSGSCERDASGQMNCNADVIVQGCVAVPPHFQVGLMFLVLLGRRRFRRVS